MTVSKEITFRSTCRSCGAKKHGGYGYAIPHCWEKGQCSDCHYFGKRAMTMRIV